ncbi:uncharacterized protein STEHIDRAFT_146004, partial [Stereum hirsutum FP-91666 SS1]|uniref:uncharacterized protein n=1 Tax=Stereum hirsutum (strain FP-91666) TaxID=721885 RepID=UPI000440DB99
MWDRTRPDCPTMQSLQLKGAYETARTAVLDLGPLWMQLQWLTHTSIQVYPIAYWTQSIKPCTAEERNNRIAIAFEFDLCVVAFVSYDNMFQVEWASTRDGLRARHVHVLDDWTGFLQFVADWYEERIDNPFNKLVTLLVNVLKDDWSVGIGVYTVAEILFLSGISPFLTEKELTPSRLARACESTYQYGLTTKGVIWKDVVLPTLHDTMIAPTDEQRLNYAYHLYVYGKEKTYMPSRMATLLDRYEAFVSSSAEGAIPMALPADIFEPTYIADALSTPGHLGHLVFGRDKWRSLAPSGWDDCAPDDPLTAMFRRRGMLDVETNLDSSLYGVMRLRAEDMRIRVRPTFTYKCSGDLVWTVQHAPPPRPNIFPMTKIYEADDGQRNAQIFHKRVLESMQVAIGPLEFCANARLVKSIDGRRTYVLPCRVDPLAPAHLTD